MKKQVLRLDFDMRAVPKQRPVVTKNHGTFTPEETRLFEYAIRMVAIAQTVGQRKDRLLPFEGPISVLLTCYFKRPKKARFSYPPKIDLDNCVKSILDGLQGVVFKNDSQITAIQAYKQWYDEDKILVSFWEKM